MRVPASYPFAATLPGRSASAAVSVPRDTAPAPRFARGSPHAPWSRACGASRSSRRADAGRPAALAECVRNANLGAAAILGPEAGPRDLLEGVDAGGSKLALEGVALGAPLAALTGRVRPGEPTLAEALGAVLVCGGVAMALEVSFLLASMVMGAVVANLASHHRRPFHAIEGIEWPFMVLFFVLAGASFRPDGWGEEVGGLALAYLVLRTVGRLMGGWLGARLAHREPVWGRWVGLALLPQAGIALGMALVAAQRFPEVQRVVIPAVVATTVLFELVGPILTRVALGRVNEAGLAPESPAASPAGEEEEES